MRCHRCNEETLDDATICHICGSYLVGHPQASTGVTQRLEPPRFCARCQGLMEAGSLVVDQRKMGALFHVDWVPTDPESGLPPRTLPLLAVIAYRCLSCGTVDLVVPPGASTGGSHAP